MDSLFYAQNNASTEVLLKNLLNIQKNYLAYMY